MKDIFVSPFSCFYGSRKNYRSKRGPLPIDRVIIEMKSSDSDYVTYGGSDYGVRVVKRMDAISQLEDASFFGCFGPDAVTWWKECDKQGRR